MASRSGPNVNIRTAATYVANDTWYSTTAFQMGPQANTLCLYATVAVASAGNIEFYVQHGQDGTTYFDLCAGGESPEVFGPITVAGADTRSIVIPGLPPNEYVQVYFRCSAGAASATLGLRALSYLDESASLSASVSVGDVEVSTEIMDDWDGTEDVALGAAHDGCVTLVRSVDLDGSAIPTRGSAEGDAIIPAATNEGVLLSMQTTEDGADSPVIPLDAAPTAGEGTAVVMAGTRVADFDGAAIPSLAGTQNDAGAIASSSEGVVFTQLTTENGASTPLAAHDAAIATGVGTAGIVVEAEAETLGAISTVDAVGDATRLKASTSGVLHVGITDPTGAADVGTAIQTAVEIMDDWDESDRAKVNPIAGQAGIAANAGAMDVLTTRVTIATDDTHMGAVGAAADPDGVIHGQLRSIAENTDTLETLLAKGTGAMAASHSTTLATDDTQFGAVGAAADVDGNVHGQLRFIGEAVDGLESDLAEVAATVYVDDGAWTNDTSKHQLVGGIYQSTPQTVTDGKTAPLSLNANGHARCDINSQTLTAVKISKDANANATANRIFTAANVDQIGGNAVAADRGAASTGCARVVEALDRTVTNATGTGSGTLATTAISANFDLVSVTILFGGALAAAETVTVTLNALDGAAYDAVLDSVDVGTSGQTSYSFRPNAPIPCENGDEIVVALSANTNVVTYGLRIVTDKR